MIGNERAQGIHDLVHGTIQECDAEIRSESEYGPGLYESIVLAGGTSKIPGFKERLQKEIQAKAPETVAVKVWAPEDVDSEEVANMPADTSHLAWFGGSVLGSLQTF